METFNGKFFLQTAFFVSQAVKDIDVLDVVFDAKSFQFNIDPLQIFVSSVPNKESRKDDGEGIDRIKGEKIQLDIGNTFFHPSQDFFDVGDDPADRDLRAQIVGADLKEDFPRFDGDDVIVKTVQNASGGIGSNAPIVNSEAGEELGGFEKLGQGVAKKDDLAFGHAVVQFRILFGLLKDRYL